MRTTKEYLTAAVLALALGVGGASAATVEATVRDAKGAPVEDAVVWLMPKGGAAPPRRATGQVAQKDRQFVPLVTVVQVGTPVNFPNQDPIRHHVYSFSPPKPFEIKLYVGTPVEPVVFDKPGEVVLGCNIHDHMLAYVYVVESPWFGKSGADGVVKIAGVPPGEYEARFWHFAQAAVQAPQPVSLVGEAAQAAPQFAVPLKPSIPRPAPR